MADSKITALTAITTVNPATYPLVIVDTSDTSMAITGTTKKVTTNQLLGSGGTATLASATISGALTAAGNSVIGTGSDQNAAAGRGNLTIGGTSSAILNLSINSADTGYVIHDGTNISLVNRIAAGSLNFYTNSSTRYQIASDGVATWSNVGGVAGTAMTLNATGLGVGVASPAAKVHVVGGAAQNPLILDSTGYNHCVLKVSGTNRGQFYADATNCFAVVNSAGSATPFVVTDTGHVGIGVAPSAWGSNSKALQVGNGSGAVSSTGAGTTSTRFTHGCYFDNTNWKYQFTGVGPSLYELTGANAGSTHAWYVSAGGTAGNNITFTQAMTLDASGNLLVGKTATNLQVVGCELKANGTVFSTLVDTTNAAASSYQLYSTGAATYRFYVGMGGTVFATNTTISGISDARLKENVQDIDVGLGAILALKPRKFDWKAGKGKDIKGDRGFIAQEFETVFPNLIDEWKDEAPEGEAPYKSVRQDLIPVLVKAIQELAAEVNALKNA